jgi:tetratricopeptide (TPR) repeat protein
MRRSVLFAALLATAAAAPSPAQAEESVVSQDVSRAESYAAEAFEAYSRKDYEEAVVLYLKALEASPSPDILYNLAKIYDTKLKDRDLAMKFYRRYIADPGADPDRVRSANARLAELRELEVAAADQPATAMKPPTSAKPTARERDQRRLPPPDERGGLTGLQVAGLATGLVGVGGVAVGAVFGLSAKSDADVAHEDCEGNSCSTQRGVDAAEEASSKAMISTMAFAAGGVLTAVGTILLVSASRAPAERDAASVKIGPLAGPTALGTQLSGRF